MRFLSGSVTIYFPVPSIVRVSFVLFFCYILHINHVCCELWPKLILNFLKGEILWQPPKHNCFWPLPINKTELIWYLYLCWHHLFSGKLEKQFWSSISKVSQTPLRFTKQISMHEPKSELDEGKKMVSWGYQR